MKKLYLLFTSLFILLANIVIGQTQIFTLSSATSGQISSSPIQTGYMLSHRTAYLLPQGLFTTGNLPYGALISSIAFERGTGTESAPSGGVCKIYMENKPVNYPDFGSGSLVWANITPTATLLFNGDPASIIGNTPGFKTFPFGTGAGTSSSFTYTGGPIAIYIEISWPAVSYNDDIYWNVFSPSDWTANSSKETVEYSAGIPSTLQSSNLNMPFTRFEYTNPLCSAPPTAGTTLASASGDVCMGAPITISLTGNGYGAGQKYQLQSATTSGGTYTNIDTPLSMPYRTFPATATLWYRYAVMCGTQTSYSTSVKVNVPILFPGGTYTIDKSKPTGGVNFNTFTEAAAAVSCGISGPVVFNVAPGATRYNEQFEMPHIYTTSVANTITFNGNNDTIAFAGTIATPHTVSLKGTDYIRFNDLHFIGTNSSNAVVLHLWNAADNNIFTRCTFTAATSGSGANLAPVVINSSANIDVPYSASLGAGSNNAFINCDVKGGYYGILMSNTTYNPYQQPANGNKIINCNIKDFCRFGIKLANNSGLNIISNNIERPTRTDFIVDIAGMHVSGSCPGILIEKNKIHDFFTANPAAAITSFGIQFVNTDGILGNENRVIDNVVYNMYSNAAVIGMQFNSVSYVKLYHNTVCLDYAAATAGNIDGIRISSLLGGIDVRNNNISIVRGGSGIKSCISYSGFGRVTIDNNNYYINSPAGTNYIGIATKGYVTLSNWQQGTGGLDMNSTTIDPVFANAATGNLRPTSLALDNKGANVGIITDILGVPRDASVPDVGAYEFGTLPCGAVDTVYASNVRYDSATITWRSVPGATSYEYIVDQVRTNPSGTLAPTTDTSYFATSLTAGTRYYVHVRTTCITGNISSWMVDSFMTPCIPVNTNVAIHPSSEVCHGDTVTLSVSSTSGATYQWYQNGTVVNGAIDTTYKAITTGSYKLYVTTTSLCQDTSVNNIITVYPLPVPVITANGAVLTTGIFTAYQWYKNGVAISGATGQSYTSTDMAASYTVVVTDTNGCSNTSAVLPPSGIASVQKDNISIYPNPTSDVVNISSPVAVKVAVKSIDGKTLLQIDNGTVIDLRSLPPGVYIVNVSDMERNLLMTERIIKVQ